MGKDRATIIAEAITAVQSLRQSRQGDAALAAAVAQIKRLQAQRFRSTYADLLVDVRYQNAARFFLQELYSEADFAQRDEQFARIAAPLERLFPANVVQTAQALALLHAKTESLDDAVARAWLAAPHHDEAAQRYVLAWRSVGRANDRRDQLAEVLHLGRDLDRLTRTLGLRRMLKMMRAPATLAGLSSLQQFLESGFDAFASMRGANAFLEIIDQRERAWLRTLFDEDPAVCAGKLAQALT
jgi:hypothetical protein